MNDHGLTNNQKLFCDEYLIDRNASRAYSAVYTNCKQTSLGALSCKLLKNVKVASYIEERMNSKIKSLVADQDEILETFTKILRGEEKDQFGFDVSIKDRISAGKELAKRYGLFDVPEKPEDLPNAQIKLTIVDNSSLEEVMYAKR